MYWMRFRETSWTGTFSVVILMVVVIVTLAGTLVYAAWDSREILGGGSMLHPDL